MAAFQRYRWPLLAALSVALLALGALFLSTTSTECAGRHCFTTTSAHARRWGHGHGRGGKGHAVHGRRMGAKQNAVDDDDDAVDDDGGGEEDEAVNEPRRDDVEIGDVATHEGDIRRPPTGPAPEPAPVPDVQVPEPGTPPVAAPSPPPLQRAPEGAFDWLEFPREDTVPPPLAYRVLGNTKPRDPNKRRLILAISSGHTGTMWLVRVLRCTGKGMIANHEMKPSLVSFHQVLLHGLPSTYELRKAEKWDIMEESISNATFYDGTMWADISHMFIKSWADIFLEWLHTNDPTGEKFEVEIVVLRRYMPIVLRSYLTDKFSWNPAINLKTWSGGEYTIHHRNYATLQPLLEHGQEDSADMILGYLFDMEVQYDKFRKEHPEFRYIEFRAEELFTLSGLQHFLNIMDLAPWTAKCMKQLSYAVEVNPHVKWRCPALLNVSTDVFEARVLRYAQRYRDAGVALPEIPSLRNVTACNHPNDPNAWCELPIKQFSPADIERIMRENPIPNNKPPVDPNCPDCALVPPSVCQPIS